METRLDQRIHEVKTEMKAMGKRQADNLKNLKADMENNLKALEDRQGKDPQLLGSDVNSLRERLDRTLEQFLPPRRVVVPTVGRDR